MVTPSQICIKPEHCQRLICKFWYCLLLETFPLELHVYLIQDDPNSKAAEHKITGSLPKIFANVNLEVHLFDNYHIFLE